MNATIGTLIPALKKLSDARFTLQTLEDKTNYYHAITKENYRDLYNATHTTVESLQFFNAKYAEWDALNKDIAVAREALQQARNEADAVAATMTPEEINVAVAKARML